MSDLAREVLSAAGDALAAVAKLWSDPPSPGIATLGSDGVAQPSEAVGLITGSLAWYTGAVAVVAVLVAAGRMAWQRRGQPAADLLRGLGTLVLVTGAGLTAVTLAVSAADAFSIWVLRTATGDDVEAGLSNLLALQQAEGMPVVLRILLGTAALLAAVLQVVLLVARGAVLVVLTGVLPLSASATNTDTGRAVFVRTLTWIAAFTLYQPVAALIYATAFLVPTPAEAPLVAALTGITFLGLAIAALPALLRLLRPLVRTVAAGSNRTASTVGGLPTGARAVVPVALAAGRASAGASGSSRIRVDSARGAGTRAAPARVVGTRTAAASITRGPATPVPASPATRSGSTAPGPGSPAPSPGSSGTRAGRNGLRPAPGPADTVLGAEPVPVVRTGAELQRRALAPRQAPDDAPLPDPDREDPTR